MNGKESELSTAASPSGESKAAPPSGENERGGEPVGAARERSKRRSPEERRAAILDTAAVLFFEQGYAATSIDTIIERIGGSKRDVYRDFGSKEGLFEALVSEISDTLIAVLDLEAMEGGNLRETLIGFGKRVMTIYMTPKFLGIYHIILSETPRFPKQARAFYDKGPGRTAQRVAAVIEAAVARGEVDVDDPVKAADLFFGMFRGNLHFQVILGLRDTPDAAEIDRYVTTAVDLFLNGLRARD